MTAQQIKSIQSKIHELIEPQYETFEFGFVSIATSFDDLPETLVASVRQVYPNAIAPSDIPAEIWRLFAASYVGLDILITKLQDSLGSNFDKVITDEFEVSALSAALREIATQLN